MTEENDKLGKQRRAALAATDALPSDLRACVHDFGWPIVEAFVRLGVTNPKHIRHLVCLCWLNAQGTGAEGRRGMHSPIDAMLIREGGAPNSRALAALLRRMGLAIMPIQPTPAMVAASIAETAKHGPMTKEVKHRVRLAAALKASADTLWPDT